MPKKKQASVLMGLNGEMYFMNRAAKKRALRLGSKGTHVPMQTVQGTIRLSDGTKISAWNRVKNG